MMRGHIAGYANGFDPIAQQFFVAVSCLLCAKAQACCQLDSYGLVAALEKGFLEASVSHAIHQHPHGRQWVGIHLLEMPEMGERRLFEFSRENPIASL